MAVGTSTGILSTRVRSEVGFIPCSHAEHTGGGGDADAAAGSPVCEAGQSEADGRVRAFCRERRGRRRGAR